MNGIVTDCVFVGRESVDHNTVRVVVGDMVAFLHGIPANGIIVGAYQDSDSLFIGQGTHTVCGRTDTIALDDAPHRPRSDQTDPFLVIPGYQVSSPVGRRSDDNIVRGVNRDAAIVAQRSRTLHVGAQLVALDD